MGSVWVDIQPGQESGDALTRSLDHERGEAVRLLGRWEIQSHYKTRGTDMALIRVIFNSGEEGKARVKIGYSGYVDVYKVAGRVSPI
jgi:hypothetical protein